MLTKTSFSQPAWAASSSDRLRQSRSSGTTRPAFSAREKSRSASSRPLPAGPRERASTPVTRSSTMSWIGWKRETIRRSAMIPRRISVPRSSAFAVLRKT